MNSAPTKDQVFDHFEGFDHAVIVVVASECPPTKFRSLQDNGEAGGHAKVERHRTYAVRPDSDDVRELCLDHGHGYIAGITHQSNDPRGQDIAGSWGEELAGLVRFFDRLLAFEEPESHIVPLWFLRIYRPFTTLEVNDVLQKDPSWAVTARDAVLSIVLQDPVSRLGMG